MKAVNPITAVMDNSENEITLERQSDPTTSITFSVKGKSSAVLLDSQAVRGWAFNVQYKSLIIKVLNGRTDSRVR